MNDFLLKSVTFAILKNVLRISVEKFWNTKFVILKGLSNDFITIDWRYYNNRGKFAHFEDLDSRLTALEKKPSISIWPTRVVM